MSAICVTDTWLSDAPCRGSILDIIVDIEHFPKCRLHFNLGNNLNCIRNPYGEAFLSVSTYDKTSDSGFESWFNQAIILKFMNTVQIAYQIQMKSSFSSS